MESGRSGPHDGAVPGVLWHAPVSSHPTHVWQFTPLLGPTSEKSPHVSVLGADPQARGLPACSRARGPLIDAVGGFQATPLCLTTYRENFALRFPVLVMLKQAHEQPQRHLEPPEVPVQDSQAAEASETYHAWFPSCGGSGRPRWNPGALLCSELRPLENVDRGQRGLGDTAWV